MIRFRNTLLLATLFAVTGQISLGAQTNSGSSDFQEVYDLIRQHATGVSQADLDRAAVRGMIMALGPKVMLVTNNASAGAAAGTQLVTQSTVFEGNIAYVRVVRVDAGLAKIISAAYQQMNSTNKVSGIVVDVRYADGTDYQAATETAD